MSEGVAKRALITGASSGIGYELARCFARDGYEVALLARDPERLARAAEALRRSERALVTTLAVDLAQPAAVEGLLARLREDPHPVDALVNNAGVGAYGPFAAGDPRAAEEMLQVNVVSLTRLTRALLPSMLARRAGKILNVASTAAFQPGPLMAVYYATKAYALSFSEALANELRGSGVSVTALCPGPTRSQFQRRAGVERIRLMRSSMMDAEPVARLGYDGLMRGRTLVIPGWRNTLLAAAVRLAPRGVVTAVVRWMQESSSRPLDLPRH